MNQKDILVEPIERAYALSPVPNDDQCVALPRRCYGITSSPRSTIATQSSPRLPPYSRWAALGHHLVSAPCHRRPVFAETATEFAAGCTTNFDEINDLLCDFHPEITFVADDNGTEEIEENVKPEASTEEDREASSQSEEDTSEKLKIERLEVLLLDDEFRMGRVFQRILRDRANVRMAITVSEAWRLLDEQSFDVIFCDVHLPGVSGIDFFRGLEEQNPELAKRTIFITGGLYSKESQKLVREVDNPVVYKPFNLAAIAEALDSVLK